MSVHMNMSSVQMIAPRGGKNIHDGKNTFEIAKEMLKTSVRKDFNMEFPDHIVDFYDHRCNVFERLYFSKAR